MGRYSLRNLRKSSGSGAGTGSGQGSGRRVGRGWIFAVTLIVLIITAQLSTGNQCGNEQRDWHALTFPKGDYCSVPTWLPFNRWYEKANKAVCKVHDNNSGIYGAISQGEADFRFLCDYVKRSKMPWGLRHLTGLISYAGLRGVAAVEWLRATFG